MSRDRFHTGCVVFVGNLPGDITEDELEDVLRRFGRIHRIQLKTPPRPPAFAFVEFEEPRAADEAARKGDVEFRGTTLRIELARGGGPPSMSSYSRGAGRNTRSPYRVLVKGLPPSASWQDVKDHFRKVVDPTFAKVYTDRDRLYGVVEFDSYDDLKYAIRKLDDTEFKNRYDRAFIRVVNDSDRSPSSSPSESRSRSRSRSQERSRRRRSYSESDSDSRSRSRSRSYSRSRSKSRSEGSNRRSHSGSGSPRKERHPSGEHSASPPPEERVEGKQKGRSRHSSEEKRGRSSSK